MLVKLRDEDTIAAIATPPGIGALAVIRMSGTKAIDIAGSLFYGRTNLSREKGYTVHHGNICDDPDKPIDEVLVTLFRRPNSYTGEDCAEISCHGGSVTAARVLDSLLRAGARQATPGEFTRRAFLNGKIDLSQAEAIADLIASRSAAAQEVSFQQLRGKLGEQIREIRQKLLDTCSLLEIDLDFSEEGISLISSQEIEQNLTQCKKKVSSLLSTFEQGKVLRDGVRVALLGPPNTGKSSLFNALISDDRAIVSEMPGTTRDYLEEAIQISGVLFSLIDTAGARETTDHIENEGALRGRRMGNMSDLVVAVVDSAVGAYPEVWESILGQVDTKRVLVAFNKIDLTTERKRPQWFPYESFEEVYISAKTGEGLETLREKLLGMAMGGSSAEDSGLRVTNLRHADALRRTEIAINQTIHSLESRVSNEFLALDVRGAASAIAEITGEITTEDVLNEIFGRFCVGK